MANQNQRGLLPGLLLALAASVSQAQTPSRSDTPQRTASAPRAPGVTRAVENPDHAPPDPSVDQTLPDEHQPETAVDHEPGAPQTAVDHERGGPETARDDQKLKPETASDAAKPAGGRERNGVRSNRPPRGLL